MTWHKLARPDGFDFYTGKTLNYREAIRRTLLCPDFNLRPECGGGIHISENPCDGFIGAKIPCSAYEVRPKNLVRIDERKSKAQEVYVVREITDLDTLFGFPYTDLVSFIDNLKNIPWFRPDHNPDPSWRIFTRKTWDAHRAAALYAARDAAWNAARDAARNAARDAAWNAARNAARDAARDAAWDGASDSALYAFVTYICHDLPIDAVHRDHINARWNAWQKGYAVLGDINGKLYVYSAGEKT